MGLFFEWTIKYRYKKVYRHIWKFSKNWKTQSNCNGTKKSEARVLLAVEYLHNKQNCKVNISTISKSLSITPLSTTEFVKSLARKITFFAILLGIGLPFQNWFRVNVLFSMERSYLPWTISMMVCGAVFMTIFYGFIKDKLAKKEEEEVVELTEVTE